MSSPLGLIVTTEGNNSKLIPKYKVYNNTNEGGGSKVKSIFNRSVFSPFPRQVADSGNVTEIKKQKEIHNDDIYDLSINSIIEYTNKPQNIAMKLSYADFAYLKNVGVYPNNRMIVARRFGSGVGNDLHVIKTEPMATLISWVGDDKENFFNVSYSEKWIDADASYVKVLNDMGSDLRLSGDENNNIGSFLAGGAGLLPFPGLTEPLQRAVFKKLGLIEGDVYNLPLGNPNLIREAKQRSTVSKDEPGSGLNCDIEIDMVVEYEQKFINGVDPSLVYLDIIQNALTFGTSNSDFQMSKSFQRGVGGLLDNLISGNYKLIFNALEKIVKELFDSVKEIAQKIADALVDPPKTDPTKDKDAITKAITEAFTYAGKSIGAVIGKYRVRLMGITNALTGNPSCPWHITIGNPKKPVFSSGDMLLSNVNLELGKVLSFNDLPSTIKLVLKFKNARPLGAQEIFNRLNTGKGRSYLRVNVQKETSDTGVVGNRDVLVTGSFEDSPPSGTTVSNDQYAFFPKSDSNLPDWIKQGKILNSMQTAAGETNPVNMANVARDDSGNTIKNAESPLGVGGVEPSANQFTDAVAAANVKIPADKSIPNQISTTNPLTDSQILSESTDVLNKRKDVINQKSKGLISSIQSIVPNSNESVAQRDALSKDLMDLENENIKINREIKSRSFNTA